MNYSTNFEQTVVLVIADAGKRLSVHKDLLCFYSIPFTATLKNSDRSGAEEAVYLYDDPEVAGQFVRWLYNQTLEGIDHSTKIKN